MSSEKISFVVLVIFLKNNVKIYLANDQFLAPALRQKSRLTFAAYFLRHDHL